MHYEASGQKAYSAGTFDFSNGGVSTNAGQTIGYQYYGVYLASGVLTLCSSATQACIGILLDAPAAGQLGMVRLLSAQGTCNVIAGAAISANSLLVMNASGQAITATQTAGGSQPANVVFGRALEAATGAGQIIEFLPMNIVY